MTKMTENNSSIIGHYPKDQHIQDWIKQLTLEQQINYYFSRGKLK